MKTAESIERQESRKEDEKKANSLRFSCENTAPVTRYVVTVSGSNRIGGSRVNPGNPGGRPKVDLASEIARALFENDGEAIYAAFQKGLRKGSP
jgi:hypothetical protein